MKQPKQTPLVESLPASVPFVGPEALERTRHTRFAARLGANESVFGPAPSVLEAIKKIGPHPFPVDDNLLNRLFTDGLMIGFNQLR